MNNKNINENTFTFKSLFGHEYKIKFTKGKYLNNKRLYIGCLCWDEDGYWVPYGDVTKNLNAFIGDNVEKNAYLDENNYPDLIQFMREKGFFKDTGILYPSGWSFYPLVKFTDEFLAICEEIK